MCSLQEEIKNTHKKKQHCSSYFPLVASQESGSCWSCRLGVLCGHCAACAHCWALPPPNEELQAHWVGARFLLALELAACAAVNAGVLPWLLLTYSPCDAPSDGGSSNASSWQEQLSPELGHCGDLQGAESLRAILDPIFLLQECCLQMQQWCEGSGLVSSSFPPRLAEVVPWSLWAQAVKVLLILFLNAPQVSPDIQAGNSFSCYQLNYPLTTSIISLYQNIIYIY